MTNKLNVDNLTLGVNDSDLEDLFAPHGLVQSAHVVTDPDTGRIERLWLCRDGHWGPSPSGHCGPERQGQ